MQRCAAARQEVRGRACIEGTCLPGPRGGGLTRGPRRVQADARVARRGSLPLVRAAEAVRSQAADGPGGL